MKATLDEVAAAAKASSDLEVLVQETDFESIGLIVFCELSFCLLLMYSLLQ